MRTSVVVCGKGLCRALCLGVPAGVVLAFAGGPPSGVLTAVVVATVWWPLLTLVSHEPGPRTLRRWA